MKYEESKLQQSCVRWFRMQYPQYSKLLFAVPNGSKRPNPRTGAILKAEGVVAGVADLLLLVPSEEHHGLCIEMKTDKGRQRGTQKDWQIAVEEQGYQYAICRSIEDFISTVSTHIKCL